MNRKQFFQGAKSLINSGEETLICNALYEAYGRASFRTDQDYEVLESCIKTIQQSLSGHATLGVWCFYNGLPLGDDWHAGAKTLARMAWLDKLIEAENE